MHQLLPCSISTCLGRFSLSGAYETVRPWNMRLILTSDRYVNGQSNPGIPDVIVINLHGWNPPAKPNGRPIPWERISLKISDYPGYAFNHEGALIENCNQTLVQINQWSTDRALFKTMQPTVDGREVSGLSTGRGFIPSNSIQQFISDVAHHFGLI